MGSEEPVLLRLALEAMRTRFELVLTGVDEAQLRAIGEEALAEIAECERRLSFFDPGSLISRVNALAHRRPVELDADTFDLLTLCADVHRLSGGAFDVTVGPMMRALFHQPAGVSPPRDAIADAARAVGMDGVVLDPERRSVRFDRPGMAIDLGAVGKGHALDLAAAVLREHGIERALLHGGTSTVVALGAPPNQPGWRVRLHGDHAPCAIVRDGALSVSAQHGRQTTLDGARLGHVLDPRHHGATAGPVMTAVLAPRAQTADAWSTALLVADGVPTVLALVAAPDAAGALRWTPHGTPTSSFFETPHTQLSA